MFWNGNCGIYLLIRGAIRSSSIISNSKMMFSNRLTVEWCVINLKQLGRFTLVLSLIDDFVYAIGTNRTRKFYTGY